MENPYKIVIALVDDDRDEKEIFQIALENLALNYSFLFFEKASNFISHLSTEEAIPNIVFIDMHMPLIDGLDLLKHIRENSRFDTMHTVIYTNSVSELDKNIIKSLGTNEFVIKPPDFDQMSELLKRLIEEKLNPSLK